jgi:hypothetical protein
MNRNKLTNLFMALALGLSLFVNIGKVNRTRAQEDVLSVSLGTQAVVGTAITYQGHLTKNGSPVNGPCAFAFQLWDAQSGGNYVAGWGSTTEVSDGHFSLAPDFGAGAFTGEARWLGIQVSCPPTSPAQLLSGRVELAAAPYAHSLRPGAVVKDTIGVTTTLSVTNYSDEGTAVYGENTSLSTATDWQGFGGRFVSHSWGGVGVQGEDKAGGGSSLGYGVYGKSSSTYGYGVYGTTSSPSGYGVYGENSSLEGYGVYSAGDTHVDGELTWRPRTSYVSVSAAAFRPYAEDVSYRNLGNWLDNGWDNTDFSTTWYHAPIQLPHGATVTKMSFYWYDNSSVHDATCTLYRNNLNHGTADPMATANSSGSANWGPTEDDTIDFALVNNYLYAYYLEWELGLDSSDNEASGLGVIIEYTIEQPY